MAGTRRGTLLGLLALLCLSSLGHALPFTITPAAPLPTSIIKGFPVAAAYTVTNNSSLELNNLYINTPPHVSVASNGCGPLFNLASGASCTLNLSISGPVSSQDPNPANHLYVCLPGGTSCTGTSYPLNVTILASPLFIYAGSSTSSNGVLSVCSVDSDSGIVSGPATSPTVCPATGTGTSGQNIFTTPQWVAFSASEQIAYISDAGNATVWKCTLNTTTGALTGCLNSGATGFAKPAGLALNSLGTQAYITDSVNNRVYLCHVDVYTGTMSDCADSGAGNQFTSPSGIALSPDNSVAFIANSGGANILGCNINPSTGQLSSSCTTSTGTPAFTSPQGIVFVPSDAEQAPLAFVTDSGAASIYVCGISGASLSCSFANTYSWDKNSSSYVTFSFTSPQGITLTTTSSTGEAPQISGVYVANNGTISLCNYCPGSCPGSIAAGSLICANPSPPLTAINNILGLTLIN